MWPEPRQQKAAPLGAGISQLLLHEPLYKRAAAALAERDLTIATLRETNEVRRLKLQRAARFGTFMTNALNP